MAPDHSRSRSAVYVVRFLCVCPTYRKPWSLLEHSISCFRNQTHRNAFLMIYDDLGVFPEQAHEDMCVISTNIREPDLISKYERMMDLSLGFGKFDAIALWDDDDIYLPEHLSKHAQILEDHELSYPSFVWSTHKAKSEKDGRRKEESGNRFWASLAIRMDAFMRCGGFLKVKPLDLDFKNLMRWKSMCSVGCPCKLGEPTYVYRWEDTGCLHASAFSKSPSDTEWYQRMGSV